MISDFGPEEINKIMDLAFERLGIPFKDAGNATPSQYIQVLLMREIMTAFMATFMTGSFQPEYKIGHQKTIETIRALMDALELMFKEAKL
jgi:hypothetical protein